MLGVGAVLADPGSGKVSYISEKVPHSVMSHFVARENQVVVTELAAVLVSLKTWFKEIRGRDVLLLVDAEAVEAALVKGSSSAIDLGRLIEDVWRAAVESRVAVYFDRVPTDSNLADGPSRGFVRAFERRGAVRWAGSGAVRGLGGTPRPLQVAT